MTMFRRARRSKIKRYQHPLSSDHQSLTHIHVYTLLSLDLLAFHNLIYLWTPKVLWDKALEMRFLLQKAFSTSNKLPKVYLFICCNKLLSCFIFIVFFFPSKECGVVDRISNWSFVVLLQEPIRSMFCDHNQEIEQAYLDLLNSSKQTLGSMMELQEVWSIAFVFAV